MVNYQKAHCVTAHSGFSLTELLVVFAVFAVLASILIPAGRGFIEKAEHARCINNLREIGIGMQGFLADHKGVYPTMRGWTEPGDGWAGPFWTDQIEAYTNSQSDEELKHQKMTRKSCFYCPSSELHHGISDYGVNPNVILSPNAVEGVNSKGLRYSRITRPAETILALDAGRIWPGNGKSIGEWRVLQAWLNSPPSKPWVANGPVPRHGNQLNVLFCDGSVRAMTYEHLITQTPQAFEINK